MSGPLKWLNWTPPEYFGGIEQPPKPPKPNPEGGFEGFGGSPSGESRIFQPHPPTPPEERVDLKQAELTLPCPVHGTASWWIRILPNGGDMVCGKCEPEPAAESPWLFGDMGAGPEYPN